MERARRSTKAKWATTIARTPLGVLVDALRGEALLRLVPGRRVLDLGHGSPEIARWIDEVATLEIVEAPGLTDEHGRVALDVRSESVDVVYSLGTLPHLGHDEDSSDRAVRTLLEEAARVLVPGGIVVVEIDNPRSLRGAAHGIRHPITVVATGGVVLAQGRRVNRYDTVSRLQKLAPRELELADIHGIRVFVALPETLAIPIVGGLLKRLEWYARDNGILRSFGAHQLVVLRKRASSLAIATIIQAAESMGSGPRGAV